MKNETLKNITHELHVFLILSTVNIIFGALTMAIGISTFINNIQMIIPFQEGFFLNSFFIFMNTLLSIPIMFPHWHLTCFPSFIELSLMILFFQQRIKCPFPNFTYKKISFPQVLHWIDNVFFRITKSIIHVWICY